jgi:hypothetical protein
MENIVEKEAKQFLRHFTKGRIITMETLKSKLTEKLYNFNRDKDKLFFLNVLRKEVENEKIEHEKTCNTPNCSISEDNALGLFLIDQEIEGISEYYEYKPKPDDEFSTQERVDLHNKLNIIADKLEEMGLGQEIIFDEIDSLKENFNLGKKNWFQLLKGKLIDLGIKHILEVAILKDLYGELSDGYDIVKSMISK